MSWSVSTSGKPDEVVKHLEAESGKVSGQAKVEYDEALPHLVGLVKQNFRNDGTGQPTLSLSANGSGSADASGKQLQRQCTLALKVLSILVLLVPLLSRTVQAADHYNSLLQPDKAVSPLQAPAKSAVQVQAPFQKSIQAPFQKSAVQKSAIQKAERDRKLLRDRARERRVGRLDARADRSDRLLGGCS